MSLKITNNLPEKFSLVFDGWSAKDTHYVAIFANYHLFNVCCYEKGLLGFSPLYDEAALNSENLVNYICFVLGVFNKKMKNVVAMTGDNCPTNLKIAKLANGMNEHCFYVGCSSHRFNLCVEDFLTTYKPLTDKINKLMHKRKNLIPSAKFRRMTALKLIT